MLLLKLYLVYFVRLLSTKAASISIEALNSFTSLKQEADIFESLHVSELKCYAITMIVLLPS